MSYLSKQFQDTGEDPLNAGKDTTRFLRALYGEEAPGYVVIWANRRSEWVPVSDLATAENVILQLAEKTDVYLNVGLQNKGKALLEAQQRRRNKTSQSNDKECVVSETSVRGYSETTLGIPGVWLEVDISDQVHKQTKLPKDEDEVRRFLEIAPIRPTMVVHSGHGLHCYWLFKKLWLFQSDQEREEAQQLLRDFQSSMRKAASDRFGWRLDNTSDLARLLRPAGTWNRKREPVPVRLVSLDDQLRYEPGDLKQLLLESTGEPELANDADHTAPDAEVITERCSFIRHCRDDAESLSEPHWYAMLSIVGRCTSGEAIAHNWSQNHASYSQHETQEKLEHALLASGPITCRFIEEEITDGSFCESCAFKGKVKSPIVLGLPTTDNPEDASPKSEKSTAPSQHFLSKILEVMQLFHTPEKKEAYAAIHFDDHVEIRALRTSAFSSWLRQQYYQEHRKPLRSQAFGDVLDTLEAEALCGGAEQPVFIRIAQHSGRIYVDLCNDKWEVVRIDSNGWEITANAPVAFRRSNGMQPLPYPASTGDLSLLQKHMGLDDSSYALLCGYLVQALSPAGPYPVLNLVGEQGTGKSTRSKQIRALVDPSTVPFRSQPRNEHDLVIAARNSWLLAYDNLSGVPPWLSDAFCRLSTGGGFGTRALYSDHDEILFYAQRPLLLNGIEDLATRADLADRSISITLPVIQPSERKTERDVWKAYERDRPVILAGLFDAVSTALSNRDNVQLDTLPRMADFALWATAAEPAFGIGDGVFMKAYTGNRNEAIVNAIESDTVAIGIVQLLEKSGPWTGATSELMEALKGELPDPGKLPVGFPKSTQAMTSRLRRIAPVLRAVGIEREDLPRGGRQGARRFRLDRVCKSTSAVSVTSASHAAAGNHASGADMPTDELVWPQHHTVQARQQRIGTNSESGDNADESDVTDMLVQTSGDGSALEFDFEEEEAPF